MERGCGVYREQASMDADRRASRAAARAASRDARARGREQGLQHRAARGARARQHARRRRGGRGRRAARARSRAAPTRAATSPKRDDQNFLHHSLCYFDAGRARGSARRPSRSDTGSPRSGSTDRATRGRRRRFVVTRFDPDRDAGAAHAELRGAGPATTGRSSTRSTTSRTRSTARSRTAGRAAWRCAAAAG